MKKQSLTQLISQFNQPDTHLVISGYPEHGSNPKNHGIAWYTKLTLEPIAKKYNQKFVVLAERGEQNEPQLFVKGNILVLRIFDSNRVHLYPQILKYLHKFSQINNVFVHSEFGVRGGIWHFGLVLPFLALIRATGRQITFFSHNVIDNIEMLSGHLNIKKNSLQAKAVNLALRMYYFSLAKVTQQVVVLDHHLAERLSRFIPQNHITVLPIPVEQHKKISKRVAKTALKIPQDKKVLLFFGFVTWYKGADWLIKTFDALSKKFPNTQLVIAGGPSYSLASKPHYKRYYKQLEQIAKRNPQIQIAGFVDEKEIQTYFAAADLAIFPYRGLMGASGCFSHALANKTPFMVSKKMAGMLESHDIIQVMEQVQVGSDSLIFSHTQTGLQTVLNTLNKANSAKKLHAVTNAIAERRSIRKTAVIEFETLYKHTESDKKAGLPKLAFQNI